VLKSAWNRLRIWRQTFYTLEFGNNPGNNLTENLPKYRLTMHRRTPGRFRSGFATVLEILADRLDTPRWRLVRAFGQGPRSKWEL
jgi:hypothetical protein